MIIIHKGVCTTSFDKKVVCGNADLEIIINVFI